MYMYTHLYYNITWKTLKIITACNKQLLRHVNTLLSFIIPSDKAFYERVYMYLVSD